MTDAETSPDVCYRHPDRASWVLCQRCGRTICPECQILAPVGVQCPDCVREAGGSVRWESAGARRPSPARAPRATRAPRETPRWQRVLGEMLRPGSGTPALSWGTLGVVLVLWISGFFVRGALGAGIAFEWFAALPTEAWQIWRFVTSAFVYPSAFGALLAIILNGLFFALTAPAVERNLGRGRFALVFVAAAAVGSAGMVLAGQVGYGLIGVLFGMFGAYLIFVWSYPPARAQALIIIGINLLISLLFGGFSLPQLVGGLIAGAGATYLLQRYEDQPRASRRTPYLIIGAVVVGFVVLAVFRNLAAF